MLLAFVVAPALGQTTVRDVNAIPQDNIAILEAGGAALDGATIPNLLFNANVGTSVTFRAVVLSDPLSSGLANVADGLPSRIHVYVRDITAGASGPEGMGIQIVDGQFQTTGLINTTIGDVVEITGNVAPFGNSMQLAPETIELLGGYADFALDASILDPVVITTSDANKSVDNNGGVQPNWTNYSSLIGQYVRLEGATLQARDISSDRPDWIVSSDGGETVLSFYDMSLRYRNDRNDYPDGWNTRDDDFTPPPPGARINLQGFLVYQRDDPFNRGVPAREILSIVPFADADLTITETPPIVTNLSKPDIVPTSGSVVLSADVVADPSRTLASVDLIYTTSDNGSERSVGGVDSGGGNYLFPFPAQADGVFATYWVRATDNTGASSVEMDPVGFTRFLAGGITQVSHIQATQSGGPGDSPFRNVTTDMNLNVTVMTQPSESGLVSVQDGTGPWSGVIVRGSSATDGLNRGDVINITNARIDESFGLTRIRDLTFTVTSTGGSALDAAVATTTAMQDAAIAESYEGMFVRFENIEVGTNQADAPSDFGEFTIADRGTTAEVRVDDASSGFSGSFNDGLAAGQLFAAAGGVWSYSFGNYKLLPEDESNMETHDVGFSVADINRTPQDNVTALDAAGPGLDPGTIAGLLFNDTVGTSVTFRAVVLSDPLSSGLANVSDGLPSRIHVYVRDVAADLLGPDGMGVQIVDGQYQTTGLINTTIGDVVEITGTVAPFGNSMQVAPESITLLGGYADFGISPSILDPVVVTTSDINKSVDDNGGVQPNWANYSNLIGQYVRMEGVTLQARDISSDRPDWIVSSDGGETVTSFYDMSLRYRNDRNDYPDGWNTLDDDFVPPPPGSRMNLQGFLVYQRDDPFNRGVPAREILSFVPFADSDLEITEAPPIVSNLSSPDVVPGADPITVTADVVADPTRNLTSVELVYVVSDTAGDQTAAGADNAGTYTFTIPAQADGVFVNYYVRAIDNTGASSVVNDPSRGYRVLTGGISQISHVQATWDSGPGDSPFRNLTTDMNITATVTSHPGTSGIAVIQDDPSGAPWTGVFLRGSSETDALNNGDVINITNARIEESFGLTRLRDFTFTVESTGGAGYDYAVVTSPALSDPAIAEAYEGMMIRMEGVEVGTNQADAPNDFGEFTVGTTGSGSFVRVDDQSADFSGGFNDDLTEGQLFEFVQGAWSYSFGNYKLWPESASDVGTGGGVAVEDSGLPGKFELHANYPNPFNPATTIRYDVAGTEMVRLAVFDVLGRQVSSLVNGQQSPGRYTVDFNASNLASGVYIYRLEAGTRVFTRTMLLLK
jgi:Secretion system C-terminal sorting domain